MCQSSLKNKSRLEGTTISNGRIVSNINKRTHSFVRYHSPLTNFFTHKSFSCNCNHIQHTKFNSYQTKNLAILTHYFKTTLLMCGRIHEDFLGGKKHHLIHFISKDLQALHNFINVHKRDDEEFNISIRNSIHAAEHDSEVGSSNEQNTRYLQ